jgi:hypothetical protein
MLDGPMGEADAANARAAAVLFDQDHVIGLGYSRAMTEGDWATFAPPQADGANVENVADDALAAIVAYAERWAADPGTPAPAIDNPIIGPTDGP